MKRISVFLLLVVSSFLISCGQKSIPQPQSHKEKTDTLMSVINTTDSMDIMYNFVEPRKIIYDENGRLIYLSVVSDLVSCYTQKGDNQPQKLFFGHVYGEDGFPMMYSHRYGNNIFLVGDFVPNSNGWTVRFPIYRINAENFDMSFIAEGAAVHFEKDGFKVAQCRLTNPDADCTANEIWVMHNSYYDIYGKKKREDKSEYDFEAMKKEYGDSLVNERRISI